MFLLTGFCYFPWVHSCPGFLKGFSTFGCFALFVGLLQLFLHLLLFLFKLPSIFFFFPFWYIYQFLAFVILWDTTRLYLCSWYGFMTCSRTTRYIDKENRSLDKALEKTLLRINFGPLTTDCCIWCVQGVDLIYWEGWTFLNSTCECLITILLYTTEQ